MNVRCFSDPYPTESSESHGKGAAAFGSYDPARWPVRASHEGQIAHSLGKWIHPVVSSPGMQQNILYIHIYYCTIIRLKMLTYVNFLNIIGHHIAKFASTH